jgi:hypothetical protein
MTESQSLTALKKNSRKIGKNWNEFSTYTR